MMLKLLELAGAVSGAAQIGHRARMTVRSIAFTVLGSIIAMVGAGFLLAALWLQLEPYYGAMVTNLWIGGGLMLLGLLLYFVGQPGPAPVQVSPLADIPDPSAYVASAAAELEKHFNAKGGALKSAAAMTAIGFVIGRILRR